MFARFQFDGVRGKKILLTINQEQETLLLSLLCDDSGNYTEKGMKICTAFKFQYINAILAKDFDKIYKAAS